MAKDPAVSVLLSGVGICPLSTWGGRARPTSHSFFGPWNLGQIPKQWFFCPQLKTGSLLNQPKAVLQKLAALSDLNPSAPRNSRNFVFHTLSPVKAEAAKESSKPQVRNLRTDSMAFQSRIDLFINFLKCISGLKAYAVVLILHSSIRYKGIAAPSRWSVLKLAWKVSISFLFSVINCLWFNFELLKS